VRSLLDKDFIYVPAKDQGPDYMQKRMEFYRRVEEERAKEQAKVVTVIKPKIRSKA
jgi:hypothetical protein